MNSYPKGKEPLCPRCKKNKIHSVGAKTCAPCYRELRQSHRSGPIPDGSSAQLRQLGERITGLLRRGPITVADLALREDVTETVVLKTLKELQAKGINVQHFGDHWSIEKAPAVVNTSSDVYKSRPDGTYEFGFVSDTHLCSKYERLDVLTDLYDRFAAAKVDRVFHTGNYIDGEARFNRYDLLVHGMDAQIAYMAEKYPHRTGLTTYAVSGDDHEGWYCQTNGVDIGRYAEARMRDAGRTDWVDLGYMEAYVTLLHRTTKARNRMLLMHPGGGTAYALSYTVQKIVESLEGGEKPAVLLVGHYHKLEFVNLRNVWTIQTGCTTDQTPFARKKKIQYALGGGICRLEQDPSNGAIVACRVELFQYFNTGYYVNRRWSLSGAVGKPPRQAGNH